MLLFANARNPKKYKAGTGRVLRRGLGGNCAGTVWELSAARPTTLLKSIWRNCLESAVRRPAGTADFGNVAAYTYTAE